MPMVLSNGLERGVEDVHYSPGVHARLVSLGKLEGQGWDVRLRDGGMELRDRSLTTGWLDVLRWLRWWPRRREPGERPSLSVGHVPFARKASVDAHIHVHIPCHVP